MQASSIQLSLPMDLIGAVDKKVDLVRTRSLDVSFNEILDMYKNKELEIDPEYQRLFRWSEAKQSQFIESLILEMPVPPIYVIELDTNRYELIDGLQRISSYLHFRGENELLNSKAGTEDYLQLEECDIVPELNGFNYTNIPTSLQIKLKRNFIRMEVLRKESDRRLRYYLFKRLNTGGELLSDQEIRNCTIRLLGERGEHFNKFVISLSQNANFKICIATLNDDKAERKIDQELVLKFFAFKNDRSSYVHDVGDFMTEFMEKVALENVPFDFVNEQAIFEKTFEVLAKTVGEDAFTGFGPSMRPNNKLLSYHYEVFTLSIQEFLGQIDLTNTTQLTNIGVAIKELKRDPAFIAITTGGGRNYAGPLANRLQMAATKISGAI